MANPVEKRPMCQSTAGLALAADALVLTVYYKLADDLTDERFFKQKTAYEMRISDWSSDVCSSDL